MQDPITAVLQRGREEPAGHSPLFPGPALAPQGPSPRTTLQGRTVPRTYLHGEGWMIQRSQDSLLTTPSSHQPAFHSFRSSIDS